MQVLPLDHRPGRDRDSEGWQDRPEPVVGNPVASNPDFKYGDGILAAKAAGAVWDEAAIAAYVADPAAWVKTASGDDAAKSKMSFKLTAGGEDMAAYLATLK